MTPTDQRKAVQTALVPYYRGALDGEFGPLTFAAVHALATAGDSAPVPHPVIADPSNPRLAMVDELRKLLGGRETDGPNRSEAIDALWQFTSYPDGWKDRAPYCAATVCACAHRAALHEPRLAACPLPTSPSVAGLLEWAREPASKCIVFAPGERPARAGDVVIYLPKISHTGILALDYDGTGTIHTMEGNTSGTDAGSQSNGDGFWEKSRPLSLVGHFVRLAAG